LRQTRQDLEVVIVDNSGQGLVMDINPPQGVLFAAWYTFLANAGQNAAGAGQHWYTLQATIPASFSTLTDVGIFESTGGVFDQHATTTAPVGSANITWQSCSSATMAYTFTAGPNAESDRSHKFLLPHQIVRQRRFSAPPDQIH
jgi:hypothetical protein